jgi:hypothetical protein
MFKEIIIGLITNNHNDMEYFQKIGSQYPATLFKVYRSLSEFISQKPENYFSGFIIDNQTLILSSDHEREFHRQLCQGFPVLRISRYSDNLTCLLEKQSNQEKKGWDLFNFFLNDLCFQYAPHPVRLQQRINLFLNINIYSDQPNTSFSQTNLWDISQGGCFILNPEKSIKNGDPVIFTIHEFKDQTPITGKIKWQRHWGNSISRLPGHGVQFESVSSNQCQEIAALQSVYL